MTGRVLVTGPSGSLGAAVLEALRDSGWRTRGLRHRSEIHGCDEVAAGDVTRPDGLDAALADVDAVVHLAAITHARMPAEYHRVNSGGTRNLVRAAARAGVSRVLLASTRAIDPSGGAYSRSKAAAEQEVRAAGEWSIVRLPEVFGGSGHEGVDAIVEQARRGARILVVGDGRQELRPIPVADAAAALAAALERPRAAGHTYTLAGERTTVRGFANACIRIFESRSQIVSVPELAVRVLSRISRVAPLPLYPDQLARLKAPKPDPTPEAHADLDFAPPPLDQALRALAAH